MWLLNGDRDYAKKQKHDIGLLRGVVRAKEGLGIDWVSGSCRNSGLGGLEFAFSLRKVSYVSGEVFMSGNDRCMSYSHLS